MQNFKSRPDQTIISELRLAIQEERKITLQILHLINEAHDRRLYASAGFSTPFEWLTKEFGYSAAAAMRRLDSARALREVPSIEKKIKTGEVNLTNLAKVQSVIRSEEKRTGERMGLLEKSKAFEMIENKSSREAEVLLATAYPEAAPVKSESIRTINENEVRVQVTLTKQQLAALERVREVASHSRLGSSLSEIIDMLANTYLEKNDPLRREVKPRKPKVDPTDESAITPAPEAAAQKDSRPRKPIEPALRNALFRKARAKCEFIDPRTGHRCESRSLLQIDHIVPVSLGGTNDPRNLRVLCRTHNLAAAETILGKEKMRPFRRV